MKKLLDHNYKLMYSTYKWRLVQQLLLGEYNNTYHRYIGKSSIRDDYYVIFEEFQSNHKASKFNVGDRVSISNIRTFLAKDTLKIDLEKYLLLILCLKLTLGL